VRKLHIYISSAILIFGLISPAYAVTVGQSCSTVGTTSADLVCLAKGKKKSWQKLITTDAVQKVIELSLKTTTIPKNLKPALKNVRSDKSFWLDQECSVDFEDVKVPECNAGDLSGKKIMVVYGDSHASMWMTALDEIAKKSGYKIYLFAKLACPLVETTIWSYQLNRPFTECTSWQQQVLPKIQALKADLLVVTDQWKPAVVDGKKSDFDTPAMWEEEFPKALRKLQGYAKRLVVLSNNPSMQQDSVTCASKPRANLALCGAGRSQAGNEKINAIEENAATSLGATFIDTVDLACSDYLCPIVIGERFVYFDQWHFTQTYIKWLTPVIAKSLNL
jgi:hypothetical protein